MAILKCKICGGTLEYNINETIAVCEYCGTKQTVPRLDNERKANLYDRASHYRRNNEYDKAMSIYEQILSEDTTDAESYWSLVLCRYGIEYVEDPGTRSRIPTMNRAQFSSVLTDEDYKAALKYADPYQKILYEKEAALFDEIQKGILSVSQKEAPFDIFICYKETDNFGRRTLDSVLANDLYNCLLQEGYKVFFSRITLEDKLGTAYEPYIFAALNSAKVMIVVGTKPENFNAAWVKNEWSRFLALIKNGADKILIPAYKDMNAYDLPKEFSHLQAQDMAKLGYMQDLVRGIKKITQISNPNTLSNHETPASALDISALIRRVFMFLEDGEFKQAHLYCERVLDIEPEDARGYLGKLMAELKVNKVELLPMSKYPLEENVNYHKVLKYADAQLAESLTKFNNTIKNRIKDETYADALRSIEKDTISGYQSAIEKFEKIFDWKDSPEKILICQKKINWIENQERERIKELELQEKKRKRIKIIIGIIFIIVIIILIIILTVVVPAIKYNKAMKLINSEAYEDGYELFEDLDNYGDASEQILASKYDRSIALMEEQNYEEAVILLTEISGYSDADLLLQEAQYNYALTLLAEQDYGKAIELLESAGGFNDAEELLMNTRYDYAQQLIAENAYDEAFIQLKEISVYEDAFSLIQDVYEKIDNSDYITAGYLYTVGLKEDGTVVATGYNNKGQCDVNDWKDIVEVEAGYLSTFGLKSDGTVVATGHNSYNQCGVNHWKNIVSIETSGNHTVGVKEDGTVVATGSNDYGQCNVEDWKNISAVATSFNHTVGLKADGTVVAIGDNEYGQCDVYSWSEIIAIAANCKGTIGLKADGTIVTAGYAQGDGWSDIMAVSSGCKCELLCASWAIGLKTDGKLVSGASFNDAYGMLDVESWSEVVGVSNGYSHTVGLKADGTVVATGKNDYGQCEVSSWTNIKTN